MCIRDRYKDSIGKEVAPCCVSIYSAPTSGELASGYFVTGDGYAAKDMPIIENGVLKNFVLSRYGSKKTGLKRSDTVGGNYIMNSGSVSLEQMIKSTVKGLIVNRFSGGSPGADGDLSLIHI